MIARCACGAARRARTRGAPVIGSRARVRAAAAVRGIGRGVDARRAAPRGRRAAAARCASVGAGCAHGTERRGLAACDGAVAAVCGHRDVGRAAIERIDRAVRMARRACARDVARTAGASDARAVDAWQHRAVDVARAAVMCVVREIDAARAAQGLACRARSRRVDPDVARVDLGPRVRRIVGRGGIVDSPRIGARIRHRGVATSIADASVRARIGADHHRVRVRRRRRTAERQHEREEGESARGPHHGAARIHDAFHTAFQRQMSRSLAGLWCAAPRSQASRPTRALR